MRVAILSRSITTADAISNDVLGMYEVLKRASFGEVRVFAEGWTIPDNSIQPVTRLKSFLKEPRDILVYHCARGWPPAVRLFKELRCRKVIKYHNITPPEFFAPYNDDIARTCHEGQRELQVLARSASEVVLADSAHNLQELLSSGAPASRSHVLPPFHHTERLQSAAADEQVLNQSQNGKVIICTVGRVAPNKGHVSLIQAFAAYHYGYNRNSRLAIIGKEEMRLRKYSMVLRELIRRLSLDEAVDFTGVVSDSALKTYYSVTSVFLTTSNHEGFCVPLIEAMAIGVPIVAYASSAISETVGRAGVVWEERNPELIAASIDSIVTDPVTRNHLKETGNRRYAELFSNERIADRFTILMRAMIAN